MSLEQIRKELAPTGVLRAAINMGNALLVTGRAPNGDERQQSLAFIDAQEKSYEADKKENARALALADFCQVVFGLNEFAYEN